jgi:hypothetical protein
MVIPALSTIAAPGAFVDALFANTEFSILP